MFYKQVKAAYQAGQVSIGLPAIGCEQKITVIAKGLVGIQSLLLSKEEKQNLAELSKQNAGAFKSLNQ